MAQIMKTEEFKFINDLNTVSTSLAVWALDRIKEDNWSIDDCKLHLRNVAKIAGRK